MAQKKTLAQKLGELWDLIAPAMAYRTKPGCPTCLTPIMNEKGIPEIPHCSRLPQSGEKPDSDSP